LKETKQTKGKVEIPEINVINLYKFDTDKKLLGQTI
jgi:hypothetical protein